MLAWRRRDVPQRKTSVFCPGDVCVVLHSEDVIGAAGPPGWDLPQRQRPVPGSPPAPAAPTQSPRRPPRCPPSPPCRFAAPGCGSDGPGPTLDEEPETFNRLLPKTLMLASISVSQTVILMLACVSSAAAVWSLCWWNSSLARRSKVSGSRVTRPTRSSSVVCLETFP